MAAGQRKAEEMYMSMAPAAAAGSTVLGVSLVKAASTERSAAMSSTRDSALAVAGSHSLFVTLVGFLLIALGLVLVAWTAKRSPR